MLSDGPSFFQRARSPFLASRRVRSPHKRLAITLSGSFILLNDWDIPVAMVYTSDNASMRICEHVCLYKKGEERVRMEAIEQYYIPIEQYYIPR